MEQLNEVSNILWRERNLLELLAFKLDAERLLARAGRTRWLARADHEVEVGSYLPHAAGGGEVLAGEPAGVG